MIGWKPEIKIVAWFDHEIFEAKTPQEGFRLDLGTDEVILKYSWETPGSDFQEQEWTFHNGQVTGPCDETTLLLPGECCTQYHLRFAVDTAFSVTAERRADGAITLYIFARQNGCAECLTIRLPLENRWAWPGESDKPDLLDTWCGFGPVDEATGRVHVPPDRLTRKEWNLVTLYTGRVLDPPLAAAISWDSKQSPHGLTSFTSQPRSLTPPARQFPLPRFLLPAPEEKDLWLCYSIPSHCAFACRWTEPDGTRRIQTWRLTGSPSSAPVLSGQATEEPGIGTDIGDPLTPSVAYRLTPAIDAGIRVRIDTAFLPTVTFEMSRPSGSAPGEEFWLLPPQSLAPGNDLWQGSPFDEWGNWDEEKIAARLLPQPVGGRAVCVKVSPAGRLYARVYEEPVFLAQLAEGCVLCPGSVPLAEPAAPLPPLPGAVLNATVLEATVDHPRHLTGLAYFDGSENHILESLDPASLAEFDRLCPGFCLRWTEDGSLLIRRIPDSSPAARLTLKWDFDPSIRLLARDLTHTATLDPSSVPAAAKLRLQADGKYGMLPTLFYPLGSPVFFPQWADFRREGDNSTPVAPQTGAAPTAHPAVPPHPARAKKSHAPAVPPSQNTSAAAKRPIRKEDPIPMPEYHIDALRIENPLQLFNLKIYGKTQEPLFSSSGAALSQCPRTVGPFRLEQPDSKQLVIRCKSGNHSLGKVTLEYLCLPSDSSSLHLLAVVNGEDPTGQIELPRVKVYQYGTVTLTPAADGSLLVTSDDPHGKPLPFPALEDFQRAAQEKKAAREKEKQEQYLRDISHLQERCQQAEAERDTLRTRYMALAEKAEHLLQVLEHDESDADLQAAREKLDNTRAALGRQNEAWAAVQEKAGRLEQKLADTNAQQHAAEEEYQKLVQEQTELSDGRTLQSRQAEADRFRQQLCSRIGPWPPQELLDLCLQEDRQAEITRQLSGLRQSWEEVHKALQGLQEQVRRAIADRDNALNHGPL